MANDSELMDKVKDEIDLACEKHKIQIQEGSGPSYEDTILKLIHQDRVR